MKVIVVQLGARRHYAVPRLLYEAGLLERFYTDSYIGNKPWLEAALKTIPLSVRPRGMQRWLGRKDEVLPSQKVVSFDLLGIRYAWARARAEDSAALAQVFAAYSGAFNQKVLHTGVESAEVVWGFNGACLEIFEWAKVNGRRCIVEQTIAPQRLQRRLLAEEMERWPGWQPALVLPPEHDAVSEREEAEWALADKIVAGSRFVVDGLSACGGSREKCRVVPYGVSLERFQPPASRERGPRLRVLFAGEVGLRKGAPYLLEALRSLGRSSVEARFAGVVALDRTKLTQYDDVATFLGPVPRTQMTELFRWADVFVLPSVCEGSATVTYEALASGLPVITTPNAGCIVKDGVDGFSVPIRDPGSLAKAIARYHEDRTLLAQHRAAALECRERAGLGRYRSDLETVV